MDDSGGYRSSEASAHTVELIRPNSQQEDTGKPIGPINLKLVRITITQFLSHKLVHMKITQFEVIDFLSIPGQDLDHLHPNSQLLEANT